MHQNEEVAVIKKSYLALEKPGLKHRIYIKMVGKLQEKICRRGDPLLDPSIFYTCLIQFRVVGGLLPILAFIGQEAGYTLDGSPSITTARLAVVGM